MLFLHGLESGPGGTKARWLAEHYGATTPKLDTSSVEAALAVARRAVAEVPPDVVVASSFGGAVAVALLAEGVWTGPTVLIAPATRRLGRDDRLPANARVVVLHGSADEVIPLNDSRFLVEGSRADLRIVAGGNHRLNIILKDGTLAGVLSALGVVATRP